jgi:type II secretory pathway component PulF
VTLRQRIRFYQQLAVLLRAGLPIRASIDRLKERLRGNQLAVLSKNLASGERLGEAFAAAGFLPFESNLIVAGEQSGQLESIFDHIAQFWQRELEFRQALLRPLYYPVVILNLAVILGSGIELFTTPWPVVATHFFLHLAALWGAGILLFFVAKFTWSSPAMKRFWLFLPIIGRALRATFAYRWITSLRLEFTAGISFHRAISDAWRASGFPGSERTATESEEALRAGSSLTALMSGWKQLPREWVDFIETGEVSGGFEAAFKNLEAEAARDWTLAQQRMSDWVPKIVYFGALLIVAFQVIQLVEKVYINPITNMENQIDNGTLGN